MKNHRKGGKRELPLNLAVERKKFTRLEVEVTLDLIIIPWNEGGVPLLGSQPG